jgi:hypothetical protein
MNRNSFKKWGLELDEGAFAQALAALGVHWWHVLNGEIWDIPYWSKERVLAGLRQAASSADDLRGSLHQRFYINSFLESDTLPPAGAFAAAWAEFVTPFKERSDLPYPTPDTRRVRLEINAIEEDAFWLVEQLSHEKVGAASVYVLVHRPADDVSWGWPLRVGFLPDRESQALRESLMRFVGSSAGWVVPLVEFVDLCEKHDECDVLISPRSLRSTLRSLLRTGAPVKAACVLTLGRMKEPTTNVGPMVMTVRTVARASGVGLVNVPPAKRALWFKEIVRELSHDETIDVALFRASRRAGTRAPLFLASRELVESSRVSRRLKILGMRMARETSAVETINVSYDEADSLDIEPGDYHPRVLGEKLVRGVEHFHFDAEKRTASAAVEIGRRVQATLAEAPAPESQPRAIQAQVYDLRVEGEATLRTGWLQADAPHKAHVRVGPEGEGWATSPVPFPAHELPPDEGEHELTVVFTEPQLLDRPLVETVRLPRDGPSTTCKFYFRTRADVTDVEARVTVLHRNRVLQTALLRAQVFAEPPAEDWRGKVVVTPEVVVRPGMNDLGGRREFGAALILNRDTGGRHGVTAVVGKSASFNAAAGLKTLVDRIDEKLTEIAKSPEKFTGNINKDATVALLRTLAEHGHELYEYIVDDLKAGAIAREPRIQVISADPNTPLPVEFCYEREAPDEGAKLCDHAAEALEKGACPAECAVNERPGSCVCPLAFWGLKKVIERQAHSKDGADGTDGRDFRLQADPGRFRKRLDVMSGVLVAASDRADKFKEKTGGVESVLQAINRVVGRVPVVAKSWDEWSERITSEKPTLLLLLTHTLKKRGDLPSLEICDGKTEKMKLKLSKVEARHVRNPDTNPPPVVLLIGCETGRADIDFINFVAKFRRKGAGIVVSTGSTILGRHAVAVAGEFVALIDEYAKQDVASFGDVMLAVRRRMLARGTPMVLALTAYGDADWQIGKKPEEG